jgi:uncharacterized protein HemX
MCPRGEVGAGIIVISIHAGISGPAVELAVVCLVINLVLSGAFVTWTRQLARASEERVEKLKQEAMAARAARHQLKKAALERRAQREKEKAEKRERRKAEKLARQAEEGGKTAEAESPKGGILQLFMGKRESYYSA